MREVNVSFLFPKLFVQPTRIEVANSVASDLEDRDRVNLALARPSPSEPPIAVSIHEAQRLLSVSRTTVFDLMRSNELKSFRCGRRRLILLSSIHDYVNRRIALRD